MTINANKSFEVSENGITVDSGTTVWIGGGDAVPTHEAPVGSFYLRTNGERYSQVGPGLTDWDIISAGGGDEKAGEVLKASFTGNPKTATVSFSTAYDDTNYAVTLTPVVTNNVNSSYLNAIEDKTVNGFTINLLTNNINDLVSVMWTTAPYENS